MYDFIKTLVAQLLMPLPISIGLLLIGLMLGWRQLKWPSAAFAGLGILVLILASWAPIAERLLRPFETRYPALVDVPSDISLAAVVVLGGGWQPDAPISSVSKLNESSAIRLMEGIRLWRQAPELPLIVSGASRNAAVAPVAQGYAQAAQSLGVPLQQLHVLEWPTDTGQEAQAVRQLLGEGASILLVTSASHMPRAMRHFQAVGLSPIAAPTHYLTQFNSPSSVRYWVPSASHLHKTERAVYEALGNLMVNIEH